MQLICPLENFRVPGGAAIDLGQWPTRVAPLSKSKKHYHELLDEYREEISDLQGLLYAHNRYALLLVFQGMDTAGKGGAIKHVMSGVNPQGCQVFTFGPPSDEELDHDFLWRTNKCLPERGRIGIFDRSYYEEVLIVRVQPEILAGQRLPAELVDPQTLWHQRFTDIVNLESYLHRNGTRTVKFFLHLSREEQRQRLLARIADPQKNWKFRIHDLDARRAWDAYQHAFAQCLGHTSCQHAPWYVVPADDKQNARLIVSHIVLETLKALPLEYPRLEPKRVDELREAKRLLEAEA